MIDKNSSYPRRPRPPLAPANVSPTESTRRILVVDDDAGIRYLLVHILRGEGYRVVCAEDGEAGWDALCASSFDAMITDHEMPRLNGLGLLRRVRARTMRLPVILISGDMPRHDRDLERLLTPGLAIDKPFLLAEFLVSVRDTFGRALKSDLRSGNDGAPACRANRPTGVEVSAA